MVDRTAYTLALPLTAPSVLVFLTQKRSWELHLRVIVVPKVGGSVSSPAAASPPAQRADGYLSDAPATCSPPAE
jgi:hypothetical protein